MLLTKTISNFSIAIIDWRPLQEFKNDQNFTYFWPKRLERGQQNNFVQNAFPIKGQNSETLTIFFLL